MTTGYAIKRKTKGLNEEETKQLMQTHQKVNLKTGNYATGTQKRRTIVCRARQFQKKPAVPKLRECVRGS
jgi:hypothetical protein